MIVSNDAANRNLARVLMSVGGQSSKAMADQIMAADKFRLKSLLCTLSKADMLSVEDAINVYLELPR